MADAHSNPLAPQNVATKAFSLDQWVAEHARAVEQALSDWVSEDTPASLGEAMRYAVLDGGKRLRPMLVLAASQVTGAPHTQAAMRAACAVELIHAYSLVHDDMPCMDDDVLRRGKPTVHVRFGQAQALLAGDALQALAFELLVPDDGSVPPALGAQLCLQLARAAGVQGMAGGQAIDLASVGLPLSQAALERMHALKTGALLRASVLMGAACGPVPPAALPELALYGQHLGLAFQVVDDVLDVVADTQTLGKTAGKDAHNEKPTFVGLLGLDAASQYAHRLLGQAHAALDRTGLPQVAALHALADLVGSRTH